MKSIEIPDDVFKLAQSLAERCEWTIEHVLRQALEDADDLQCQIEACDTLKLERLAGGG